MSKNTEKMLMTSILSGQVCLGGRLREEGFLILGGEVVIALCSPLGWICG